MGAPEDIAAKPQDGAALDGSCERHRVHHSYIWLGSLRLVGYFIVAVVVSQISSIIGVVAGGELAGPIGALTAAVVAAIVFAALVVLTGAALLYQWLSYRHLCFTLDAGEISVYKGIFNKTRVHVPYGRVQSVDQKATLLQRLFGVCTVSIDTAGGSANKAVAIPYLTKQQAEWLRAELFARKRAVLEGQRAARQASAGEPAFAAVPGSPESASVPGAAAFASATASAGSVVAGGNVLDAGAEIWNEVGGVFSGSEVYTGRVSYEYGLTNKELVFTGLSNNTAFVVVVLGIVGVLSQASEAIFGMFPQMGDAIVSGVGDQMSDPLGKGLPFVGLVALGFLAGSVVLWALSAVGSCVSYGGFRARRRDSRIEVEHGLLQHTFQGIDVDRIQAVVVKQGFIRRLIGYGEVSVSRIDAASESDASQQNGMPLKGVIIHPFVKIDRVPEILQGLLPEYRDVPQTLMPLAPVALRRGIIRRCVWQGDGFWVAVCAALVHAGVVLGMGEAGVAALFETSTAQAAAIVGYAGMGCIAAYVLALVLFVLDAIGAVLWFRQSGFSYNRRFMQIANGGFSRETISVPRQKIQFGCVRTNPFQRLAGTATVAARTAAGAGGTTVRLIDAGKEDADRWLEWLEPRKNVIQ